MHEGAIEYWNGENGTCSRGARSEQCRLALAVAAATALRWVSLCTRSPLLIYRLCTLHRTLDCTMASLPGSKSLCFYQITKSDHHDDDVYMLRDPVEASQAWSRPILTFLACHATAYYPSGLSAASNGTIFRL